MTSAAPDTLSLSPVQLMPVQNGEGRELPIKEDMGGLESFLIIV